MQIINADNLDYIFDVTGVITRHLIKVSLILLAKQKGIFAFEMHKKLVHNEEDLIHNLDKKDYDYFRLNVQDYTIENKGLSTPPKQLITKSLSIQITKEKWLDEIAKGKLEKVINELLQHSKKHDYQRKEIINLSSRHSNLKQLILQGIIQPEEHSAETIRINNSLVEIISLVEE